LYAESCEGYEVSYFNQQCSFDPQYDTQCPGYQAPVEDTVDPVAIDNGISTGDSVVDSILATPDLPVVNLIPDTPEPIEVPQPEIVMPDIPEVEVVVEVPTTVEQIELEVEAQIEQELEIEIEIETPTTEETTTEEPTTEESTTEESTEESTTEESTEDETSNEETTEESTEEESTEEITEESTEEESTEEESSNEESTEEEATEETTDTDVKATPKKKIKKLSKKQKEDAKRKKMKEIIKKKLAKLADDMGKAKSLEAQQALQQVIAALINYVPGFNAYGQFAIPGVDFYNSDEIYKDKKIPENQRGLRNGLASELLHKKMVDMQYEGME
jgi:chemotaxis protein histidine kinase CheA